MKPRIIIPAAILALAAALSEAEDSFLGVQFGARALALGSAYSAIADDAQAVLWNPAGLMQLDQVSLSGSQSHLSFTENVFALTLNVPAPGWGVFSLSIQELSIENASLTRPVLDVNGNPVIDPATNEQLIEIGGYGQEMDGTFILGYGLRLSENCMAGLAGKFLTGKAGKIHASGAGANAGLLIFPPESVRMAFVLEDIGHTTVEWDDGMQTVVKPAVRVGAAWQAGDSWLLASEIMTPLDGWQLVLGIGAEWKASDCLFFRVGAQDLDATGGIGFRMPLDESRAFASADYAFVTGSRYEDRNRLTITVGF